MSDEMWMTYNEAAAALGIKADSVRRRAAARKWPRRKGNNGKARVGIPPDIIPDATPALTPDITPDATPALTPDITPDNPDGNLRADLAAAEAKIEGLEARLADTQADRDAWRQQAERLSSEPRPAGIIERIFGRR